MIVKVRLHASPNSNQAGTFEKKIFSQKPTSLMEIRRVSDLLDISLKVRLHSGENRVKLVGFKEHFFHKGLWRI